MKLKRKDRSSPALPASDLILQLLEDRRVGILEIPNLKLLRTTTGSGRFFQACANECSKCRCPDGVVIPRLYQLVRNGGVDVTTD